MLSTYMFKNTLVFNDNERSVRNEVEERSIAKHLSRHPKKKFKKKITQPSKRSSQ